jgi:hypothetical protein
MCFSSGISGFTQETSAEDYEHYRDRLQETLSHLLSLDDAIHDLLSNAEYDEDVATCEEYIDKAKRAIRKASRELESRLVGSAASMTIAQNTPAPTAPTPLVHSFKLSPIKLEPFSGDVESWSRFWEQFELSIDKDPTLSTVNKHVLLRGYLEGEPKRVVDGIAVNGDTYEQTKEILRSKYGDKNRIIQAHQSFFRRSMQSGHNLPLRCSLQTKNAYDSRYLRVT